MYARRAYINGEIHAITAIGLCARDRDFVAGCELRGQDPLEQARRLVYEAWMEMRLARAQLDRQ
jgi:hypothetical protein